MMGGYWWPTTVATMLYSVRAYEQVYETMSYQPCGNGDFVLGTEKIALYGHDPGECLHVARQLINGMWTSKMGDLADIEHATPQEVEGEKHGRVLAFMERRFGLPRRLSPPPSELILPFAARG
jgi:hypothetical protein